MSVTINGTSGLVFNDSSTQATAATGFGFKNRIINGAMVISQRGTSAVTQTTTPAYTVDRWNIYGTVTSKFTAQQNAGSVTPPAGYINYLGIVSSSAYSVGTSERYEIRQPIEGLNIADLAWGTANAQTVTLSFWVRSSLTGTFSGVIQNNANDRTYPYTYTISSANTWEQKSITIAGDTSGTWLTTNSVGIYVQFSMGAGASYSGTAGAWTGTANVYGATGAVQVVATNTATWYVTGVQLEKGSTATSFDYRPYGTELNLAQRYYWKTTQGTAEAYGIAGGGVNGNANWACFGLSPTMRTNPTVTVYGTWGVSNCGQPTIRGTSSTNFILQVIATATAAVSTVPNSSDDVIDASAEL